MTCFICIHLLITSNVTAGIGKCKKGKYGTKLQGWKMQHYFGEMENAVKENARIVHVVTWLRLYFA